MNQRTIILVVFFLLGSLIAYNQENSFADTIFIDIVNSLSKAKSNQKILDTKIMLATNSVSNKYPELKNIHVEFIRKNIKTMMAARPTLLSAFRKKEKRKYSIIISTNPDNNSELFFDQLSYTATIGIISHEFAHILTYNNKTGVQLLLYGEKYLFIKRKIERETDKITVLHGFGKELIEYDQHIYKSSLVSKKYLKLKSRNYLSINEIQTINDN
jgi:hypothetical protein